MPSVVGGARKSKTAKPVAKPAKAAKPMKEKTKSKSKSKSQTGKKAVAHHARK